MIQMLVDILKSARYFVIACCLLGITGCASDGGVGELATMGALGTSMIPGMNSGVSNVLGTVAVTSMVVSPLLPDDSEAAPSSSSSTTPAPSATTLSTPEGVSPTDLQKLVNRETPERYRAKACDYIEMSLNEVPMYLASTEPVMKQVGNARKVAASQVWVEKGCQSTNLPRGKVGISMDTIDPQRAMALSRPSAGVVVLGTVPGSGAQQAGILSQDVIVALDGQPIADTIDFRLAVAKKAIGSRVNMQVWRGGMFNMVSVVVGPGETAPIVPAGDVSGAPLAKQTTTPEGAMYCTAVLATQNTDGATASPVKLIAGAANDMQPSLKSYIDHVKQRQPGVWGDFKLNATACAPGAAVCMAEAKGPTGKTQNAFQFCHATQAKADVELEQMRKGDPQAVVVDWP